MDLSYDLVASSMSNLFILLCNDEVGETTRKAYRTTECADQMAKYQQCVLKNEHGDWANICRPEGKALAACADASVPHLSELKNACAIPISTYRSCLDKNASLSNETIGEICAEPLKALWECSEKTMAEIEGRGSGAAPSAGADLGASRLV